MGGFGFRESTAEKRRLRQHGQGLDRGEPIARLLRRSDNTLGDGVHGRVLVPQAVDPGQLVLGEQCARSDAGLLEERSRFLARAFCSVQIRQPPSEEVGETEFHHRPRSRIDRRREDVLDREHRLDPESRVRVGPMVDHPLRLPRQRFEDVQPALVAGRDELDQGVEDHQRLVVGAPFLGLPNSVAERPNRLIVADLGGAREVGSSLAEPSRRQQRAAGEAMQSAPPDLADLLIDRLLQQRMGELVAQIPAVLRFGHELRANEWLEHRGEALR